LRIFVLMKKTFILSILLLGSALFQAQFKVVLKFPVNFSSEDKRAYLYSYNGSKEMIAAYGKQVKNVWTFDVKDSYNGIMRVNFPETNNTFNFVVENSDVEITLSFGTDSRGQQTYSTEFVDNNTNLMFSEIQQVLRKGGKLPSFSELLKKYENDSRFSKNMKRKTENGANPYPFLEFYADKLRKYVGTDSSLSQEDYLKFISNSPEYLESSGQFRRILHNYLSASKSGSIEKNADVLLAKLDVESSRGQLVLSEFIELFDLYGMESLKQKYLSNAKALKCTITDRLTATIEINERLEIGKISPDYRFRNPINTKDKTLHSVKAKRKLVMFWSSTCPHCESEMPKIIENYKKMQNEGIQVIGLSLDSSLDAFKNRAKTLPWINDTEAKGWNSTVSDIFNIHATPQYFLLDENNKILAKPNSFYEALDVMKLK